MPKHSFVLFDGNERDNLLPLTATRAVAAMRVGILTIKEKWEKYLNTKVGIATQAYLQDKYGTINSSNAVIYINACILPNPQLVEAILQLSDNSILKNGNQQIAFSTTQSLSDLSAIHAYSSNYESTFTNYEFVEFPWSIFTLNGNEIRNDIQLLELKPNPEKLSKTNTILGHEIYVEDGVQCECAILNAKDGPIYLGKDSEIMEACTIRAPFALGEHACLKMQTKIYGDTTVGPYCKVGGEVSNSVFFAYSNKGHDGFIGNSVIGEWCNLGADTNNSNLKNNYGKVKAYNYPANDFINTGLQFCGLIMGDHSKSSINTMFNTGTVVGVCANVFGGGFHPKFIPDFAWNEKIFELEKANEVAQRMMERRKINFSETDKAIFKYIFENINK
ncbi:MAG TPA: putative sugar nucleotidyl transferase [Chitinophagales bacterium]|nr:putative sugar nucleotidyl transferase [Chitinophagales bacterium]HMW11815.1 putative sugar nucleotidyl transferase [Chitinophagales bacterium]HMX59056.1 putative sugar nucleotidyl transferase [Chitinophagales bacterium]HMZ33909.1 putative sugar nucleotidyl transferase [Chitinophagales bacterium]HNA39184.1 putative sugar nucleotidyl transferase [Chitinophagales bacterium]